MEANPIFDHCVCLPSPSDINYPCFSQKILVSYDYICRYNAMALNEKIYKEVSSIFSFYLKSKKLRKTPERFAILKTIYSLEGHFDVEWLYTKIKKTKHRVSRATVYNTLDLLLACHMVAKHQFGHTVAQYEKSFGYRQHDHLICTNCNKLIEFCDPRIQTIQNTVEKLFQFDVKYHSLILYASCNAKNCASRKQNEF